MPRALEWRGRERVAGEVCAVAAVERVLMEELSWRQIGDLVQRGNKTTAILDAGAVEQHGPHLPTGTDTYLGQAIAERAARRLGNALVAPVLRPALSAHHFGFPGTFALSFETFVDVLGQMVQNLADTGFTHIALMSSHGGNVDIMQAHVPTIAKAVQPRAEVFFITRLEQYTTQMQAVLDDVGVSRERGGVHAGYNETAMMLYLHPDLVDMSKSEPGVVDPAFYSPQNIKRSQMESFTRGIKSQSPNGILGDPTGATAEVGQRLVELQAEMVAAAIRGYIGSGAR